MHCPCTRHEPPLLVFSGSLVAAPLVIWRGAARRCDVEEVEARRHDGLGAEREQGGGELGHVHRTDTSYRSMWRS